MNGKDLIEQYGLKPGEYFGQDGDAVITPEDLTELSSIEFTPEEAARMEEEKRRDLPAVDLISDEFIEQAAKLGDVDLGAIKSDMESWIEDVINEVGDDSSR